MADWFVRRAILDSSRVLGAVGASLALGAAPAAEQPGGEEGADTAAAPFASRRFALDEGRRALRTSPAKSPLQTSLQTSAAEARAPQTAAEQVLVAWEEERGKAEQQQQHAPE